MRTCPASQVNAVYRKMSEPPILHVIVPARRLVSPILESKLLSMLAANAGPLLSVHRRLTGRAALEATVLPKVLFRDATNSTLDQAVDARGIL